MNRAPFPTQHRLIRKNLGDFVRQAWNRLASFRLAMIGDTVLMLLLSYLSLEIYWAQGYLPEEAYQSGFLASYIIQNLDSKIPLAFLVLLSLYASTKVKWQSIPQHRAVRVLVVSVAAGVTWICVPMSENFFFDHSFLFDRILLLASFCLLLINPAFVCFLITLSLSLYNQSLYPLLGLLWGDVMPMFSLLVIFNAFVILRGFSRAGRVESFLFLAVCMMASNYFSCGFQKLLLGERGWEWALYNEVHNLPLSAFLNGWSLFASEESAISFAENIRHLNLHLCIATLSLELGAVFIFLNRKVTYLILASALLFHTSVFILTGIFFWKWMWVLVGLCLSLRLLDESALALLYNRNAFLLSVVVVVLGSGQFFGIAPFQALNLGWFDSNLNSYFKIEVVGESGKVYELKRLFTKPYSQQFGHRNFDYIYDGKRLTTTCGAFQASGNLKDTHLIAQQLKRARTRQDILFLKEKYGTSRFDEEKTERLYHFLRVYFRNINRNPPKHLSLSWLQAPPHLFWFGGDTPYHLQEPAERIRISFVETLYYDRQIDYTENNLIREIRLSGE